MLSLSSVSFVVIVILSIIANVSQCVSNKNNNDPKIDAFENEMLASLIEASNGGGGGGGGSSSMTPQCEPKISGFCSQFGYNSTRMPNFFKDSNQYEALERARGYKELVETKCSDKIHHYLCELLIPVCLVNAEDSMRKFEIYPCRSACRQIQAECSREIAILADRLFNSLQLPGFICEELPYEVNGADGPCDPMLSSESDENKSQSSISGKQQQQHYQQQQQSNNQIRHPAIHRPYQPDMGTYDGSPFIDNSRIDSSIMKAPQLTEAMIERNNEIARQLARPPINGLHQQQQTPITSMTNTMTGDQDQGFWSQLTSFSQTTVNILVRYSNRIGVAAIILLLLVLSLIQYQRLKHQYPFKGSRASESSAASSTASQRSLAPIGDYQHHHSGRHLSPSASSRSLMLIAGPNHKQAPTHQLIPANQSSDSSEPSQNLLLHALKQKTLINLNGTLERQAHSHQNRYIIMDHHHQQQQQQNLFKNNHTLDSQSSHQSNQYDYIQHTPSNAEQQQFSQRLRNQHQVQLYSNILLSSPSHQVLLMSNDNNQQGVDTRHPQARQLGSRGPPNSQAPAVPHYLPANMSPYDSPNTSTATPTNHLFAETYHQRSFQRRTKKTGSRGSTICDSDSSNRRFIAESSSNNKRLANNSLAGSNLGETSLAENRLNYTSPPSSASSSGSASSSASSSASNGNSSSALMSSHQHHLASSSKPINGSLVSRRI